MHFTGLKIAGFKSFVDPVDVAIEEGLTGVVGPNGCGKSNLLEALRWVMGATSARAMRGGEMDDLIFAGTEQRPAREWAEVALEIDNSDRTAPAEFNEEDKLEIRRTLRRGAGSSYKINGRTVRAKDVQILFADASTGANSPALVRQGQISELIGAKPQNRRKILEEAAGIGGLAARRHEAELKLNAAEENLNRLAEIMAEVERQVASLKRQAGRAKRYRALSEQITALESRLMAARWRGAVTEAAEARLALDAAKRGEEDAAGALARASTAELGARADLDPLRAAETEASGKLGALKVQFARLEAERETARDHTHRIEKNLQRIDGERQREAGLAEEAMMRAARAADALAALPAEDAAGADKAEADLKAALDDAYIALGEAEAAFDDARAELARIEAAVAAAANELSRAQDRYDRLTGQLTAAERDIINLGEGDELTSALAAARADADAAERNARAGASALLDAETALLAARELTEQKAAPHAEAERRVRELEAELAGLDRLLRRTEGHAAPVMDGVRAKGLERAIAAALDDDLDAPADDQAPAHWSMRHGRSAQPLPDGAAPLSDLIVAPPVLRARLSQCGLVAREDAERLQPRLLPGQRLVSIEGDLWRWDGFVRRADAPLPAAERLAQRSRRDAVAEELVTARSVLDDAAAALDQAKQGVRDADASLAKLRSEESLRARETLAVREAVLRAEQAVERHAIQMAALVETRARLKADADLAATQVNAARAALATGPDSVSRKRVVDLQDGLRMAREAERNAAAALDAFQRERERGAALRAQHTRDEDEWRTRATSAQAQIAKLGEEAKSAQAELDVARAAPEALTRRIDALASDVAIAEAARREASDAFAEAEMRSRVADIAARTARDGASSAREMLVRAETRLEAAIRREVEISNQAQAAFERELEDLEAMALAAMAEAQASADAQGVRSADAAPDTADATLLDQRLGQLRRDRDGLGAVNMEAEAQLDEIAGRMDARIAEREDLVAALAKLREGVDALNVEGRTRLMEAFEQVNAHFKSLFIALFNGGEAELRLTESDDPLNAGLEIYASPPGKRLGQLSLMSGGEQALTATALIFAVFLSRPAPMCVLDEVDAPLDDANVDRFCRLLDEMRRRTETRFIIITHNAVSMSRMDRLYGVTMQERGVSRLVSVDLEAAERLAAA